jgi:hypothetical protein
MIAAATEEGEKEFSILYTIKCGTLRKCVQSSVSRMSRNTLLKHHTVWQMTLKASLSQQTHKDEAYLSMVRLKLLKVLALSLSRHQSLEIRRREGKTRAVKKEVKKGGKSHKSYTLFWRAQSKKVKPLSHISI